ncbi:hypothetical protein [Clostridium psychrophilum]|uniref:hypothetical protein n=1 Tax=Clostridium psychrophilum TaxID=132926 RepID=UPI001C0E4033|nr:hypothetical protein [Clostridium psychrophilum]MBU3181171.1 hypothetical protein [Clostridium psychrophilum]
MGKIYFRDIINSLIKYKEIIGIIDCEKLKQQSKEIEQMIKLLKPHSDAVIDKLQNAGDEIFYTNVKKKSEKVPFEEIIKLWTNKDFQSIRGIKLNYIDFPDAFKVTSFIESRNKEQILKSTTLIDLNIIYFILSGDKRQIKKKKDEVYDMITGLIKANKQGEAFNKLL